MRRLLVCLDRSPFSEVCLAYAVALARSYRSHVRLVHVLESDRTTGLTDALDWQIAKTEAETYLSEVAATIPSTGLRIDTVLLQGHPAEQILCFADREKIDLIVLSSHGERGVTEWSLASTADKIVARTRTSVLVVPATRSTAPTAEPPLERFLVLLDGSPRAESVLQPLQRLALEQHATLVLLHVVPTQQLLQLGPPSTEDVELQRQLELRNERTAHQYLARLRERLSQEGCTVREIVEKGDLRSILPRVAAREKIDLVAFTAHGRTGDRSRSHGNTAGHLIHHLQLPTLMVQNLPQPSLEFARSVQHRREALPLRGSERLDKP